MSKNKPVVCYQKKKEKEKQWNKISEKILKLEVKKEVNNHYEGR